MAVPSAIYNQTLAAYLVCYIMNSQGSALTTSHNLKPGDVLVCTIAACVACAGVVSSSVFVATAQGRTYLARGWSVPLVRSHASSTVHTAVMDSLLRSSAAELVLPVKLTR
eukprot:GHUV01033421.1.p2 GENE.GHUV01033421.1~~GHUV01033421.1.p2  ORF type:complete len:111 (-),score=3.45 GHUV01033421.1:425-757(-)